MDILVIEDDAAVCKTIRLAWPLSSDTLRFVSTYRQSINIVHSAELRFFDGAIVDVNLPDGDGITILRTIRANADIPIVLISGLGSPDSRATAIDIGADDYVMKPFSVRELHARVARLVSVRRHRPDLDRPVAFRMGNVVCDLQKRLLLFGERATTLTDAETRIIAYLHDNLNKNCSKPSIYKNAFFRIYNPNEKTLDVYIGRLRKKLGDLDPGSMTCIQTARGFGYKLNGP